MNSIKDEKSFYAFLLLGLTKQFEGKIPTEQDIEDASKNFAKFYGYKGDLKAIVEDITETIDTRMGVGASLRNVKAEHDEQWVSRRKDIEWIYSEAYENFLRTEEGWPPNIVQSLSDVADKILGYLQDPSSEGSWDRRGLVIGHVQSGKTANYMGVIARAADAGYKFIIVIAGIHNNLRKQTQERIDGGFVGRSSDPENRVPIGVGLNTRYPHPATLTNIRDDFKKATASRSGWKLNDFSKPVIVVIKKNVHTLDALHKWLKDMNAKGNGQIADVPMLMIDDEADNASINTNKEDLDPTRTNLLIREILSRFEKSCYIGYTATPFANIFINPEAYDNHVRDELFPRDFIYSLDAPNKYFGPSAVFLDDETCSKIVKPITDCEDYLPLSHKRDHEISELPPSLYRAIDQFIVARAVRNLRGHEKKHCSMMVNVSHFVAVQQSVRNFISAYRKKMREAVYANYAMPDDVADQNSYMLALKEAFLKDYSDCGFEWHEIKAKLPGVFDNFQLYVVNNESDEVLDYKKHEGDERALTVIAVGGFSLSRGLTIEGLCISYMYRNTRMYDTLMQMGRWFGYRTGFRDLCRIHLSSDSIDWYAHIAEASEELRQQIKRMGRDGQSPKQFGLYVKDHPASLLITAANKMREGKKITVGQNFSGKLCESYLLPSDKKINEANRQLIVDYWENGFGGKFFVKLKNKGWFCKDAPVSAIEDFLNKFKTHRGYKEQKSASIAYLRQLTDKHPVGDVLLISIKGNKKDESEFRLGFQKRTVSRIDGGWLTSGYRVASRGDERLGLSAEQEAEAVKNAKKEGADAASDTHYREVRDKPLLMLHILNLKDRDQDEKVVEERVPALGISFPHGHYNTAVQIVVNRVWFNLKSEDSVDSPDNEE